MKTFLLSLFLSCCLIHGNAQLRTAKLFGDHMVLQRNQSVPVWGWSAKNAKITVNFNGQSVSTKADKSGHWKALLSAMKEGGPYTMSITSGKEQLTYQDVMLGEVWICSGQSNMEFQLRSAYGYKAEQKAASQQAIRQFHVTNKISLEPEKEVAGGEWVKADSNSVSDFTAVGYFFAKQLAQNLHVTIGLISSSWGGTQVEDWISRDAMINSPELGDAAKALPANWDGVKQRLDKQLKDFAYRKKPVVNYTADQLATEPVPFFDVWQKGNAPGSWEWQGKLYSYRGEGFMQRTIKLDGSYAARNAVLHLGNTDADLSIYVNGKLIKDGALSGNYQLELPAGTWKAGDNSLLINLKSPQKNPSWFGIGLAGDIYNLTISFADTTVNIADANWRIMPDLSRPYHFDFMPNNTAFMLYNGMINPLVPYGMAGVIWYQGEANADRAYQYRTSFPLLINDWRSKWNRDFPFLFVQLSSFGGMQDSNVGSDWAELREAQTMTLQMPNTGMAVTTDVGNAFDIHPKDKANVGIRLANKALSDTYHLPGFHESPLFGSADFSNGAAMVNFTHVDNGLMVKDKYGYIKGFELAGPDHKFYYAQAAITADNKVKVWCSQVSQPVAVRYAWTNAPVDANLFSKEGFPVNPFRSDDWPGVTVKNKFE